MNSRQPRNMAASVRQRLMNLSRQRGEEFQLVLTRYGLERLLYRLAQSPHAEQFVLKGAALFQLWTGQPHRSTRDLDLLGQGEPSTDRLRQLFQEICTLTVGDDGLTFLTDAIQAEQIKEDDEYQGIRLRIEARLGNVRVPLQVDIGFGDAVTPGPQAVTYPTLLDFPAPQLNAYPRETVVAEKFQAMVQLGMANSRMKDFYDVWTLARQFEFDGTALCAAIRATFQRRQTALPATTPLALTPEFSRDRNKAIQWNAFLRKGRLIESPPPLEEAVSLLTLFLMPPTLSLVSNARWNRTWVAMEWR
ncbi:MAG: nucleotidyl transferase AbiEii/AbiGii toxin family protein [Pirellulaceae bacterium]